MISIYLILVEAVTLLSIVVVAFYIPTNKLRELVGKISNDCEATK